MRQNGRASMVEHDAVARSALVTGGCGFLGSKVAEKLWARGWSVSVIDNLSNASSGRSGADLAHVRLAEVDLRDREATRCAVVEAQPDLVVHLAALHYIPACVADPSTTLSINVLGTQHLLDACADLPVAPRLVLASTADVYEPSATPHTEASPVAPDNVYGLSKLAAEGLVMIAGRRGVCRPLICRFFNLYGPGETNPHVIPAIIDQLREGDVLRLGNTTPKRDFVNVDDAAVALIDLSEIANAATTVNVGTGASRSVDEVIELIGWLTARDIKIEVDADRWRASDRPVLQADNALLRSLVPAALPTPFVDGLRALLVDEGIPVAR